MNLRTSSLPLIILTTCIVLVACKGKSATDFTLSEKGFYSSPESIVAELAAKEKKSAAEYYLLGMSYRDMKKNKEAILCFSNSAFSSKRNEKLRLFAQPVYSFTRSVAFRSEYYNDAMLQLSKLFSDYNEDLYSLKFIENIDSAILREDVALQKVTSLTKLKKYDEALAVIKEMEITDNDESFQLVLMIRKGNIFEKMENYQAAFDTYIALLNKSNDNWESDIAVTELNALASRGFSLNQPETILVSRTLYNLKKYNDALAMIEKLSLNDLAESEKIAAANIKLRLLTRLDKNSEIKKLEERRVLDKVDFQITKLDELWLANKKGPAATGYRDLLKKEKLTAETEKLLLGRIAQQAEGGNSDEFIGLAWKYINKYPSDELSEKLGYWALRKMVRSGSWDRLEPLAYKMLEQFPKGSYSDYSRYWLRYLALKNGDQKKGEKYLSEMISINSDSSYTWRLLEREAKPELTNEYLKKFNEAVESSNIETACYYHAMLTVVEKNNLTRLARLKKINSVSISPDTKLSNSISDYPTKNILPDFDIALQRYFQVGDKDGIKRVMNAWGTDEQSKKDRATAIVHYSYIYHWYSQGLESYKDLLKLSSLKENLFMYEPELCSVVVPRAFEERVIAESSAVGLDPVMLWSVIKAESLFNPNATSPVGARGLMQLMPGTAAGLAKQLNLQNYNLLDPASSILFGARYLNWLNKFLKGNYVDIVCGYNAGPGFALKWRKEIKESDEDIYIEKIPFDETRFYVLRTKKFIIQYNTIGNE